MAASKAPTDRPITTASPHLLVFLRVWLGVGLQSFGGGTSTLALIERAVVHERGWVTDEEFARCWALCQLAPGINLIALAILIGRRLGGRLGIVIAVGGMLAPSIAVTILITAFFSQIRRSPVAQAALRGVIPATVGLGLLAAYRMAVPLLRGARRMGAAGVTLAVCLMVASGAAVRLGLQVIAVLLAAAVIGAVMGWARPEPPEADEGGEP